MGASVKQVGTLSYGQRTQNKEVRAVVQFKAGILQIAGHSINEQRYEGYGMERISDRKGTDLSLIFYLSADELLALSKSAAESALQKVAEENVHLSKAVQDMRENLREKEEQIKALKSIIGSSSV